MKQLYEESDLLHNPFQCFYYSSECKEFPVAPHWHYYLELIYVKDGSIEVHSENEEHIVTTGEMIIFYPKTVHSFFLIDNQPASLAGIKLDINSMTFTSNYTPKLASIFKTAEKKHAPIIISSSFISYHKIDQLFYNSISEIEQMDYGYDIVIFAHLYELLILIVRFWQQNGFTIDSETFSEEENYDIFNILPYISDHLDSNLRVRDIAASCGLSYSYFAKRFQAVYGKSCKEYIEDMRVYKAEELLLFTDFDLTYISQITGFSDCSHMIKSFKERKKITPKQFRMQHKKQEN